MRDDRESEQSSAEIAKLHSSSLRRPRLMNSAPDSEQKT